MNFEQELNHSTKKLRNFGMARSVVRYHSRKTAADLQKNPFRKQQKKIIIIKYASVATLKNNMQFITLNARTIPQIIHRN